jgi:hypothetical protein
LPISEPTRREYSPPTAAVRSTQRYEQAPAPAPPPSAATPKAPPASSEDSLGFGGDTTPAAAVSGEDSVGFGDEPSAGGSSGDDVGFGDGGGSSSNSESSSSEPSPWSLQGNLREQTAIRTESQVLSRLGKLRVIGELQLGFAKDFILGGTPATFRAVAGAHGEYDFATLDHSVYDEPGREIYAWQAFPQDTYVSLNWGALELSFGKQIVPMGQGEVLSALDIVNPRDLREPVVTDPADMRLAMLMSRIGLRIGDIHLEGIVVHESNPGLIAPPLSEYSPTRKLLLGNGALRDSFEGHEVRYSHRPDATLWRNRSAQYHARLTFMGSGYELALQAASVLDPIGVSTLPTAEELQRNDIYLDLFHPRYTVLGHTGTFTAGEFVFRWEAAADLDRLTATRRIDTNLLRLESARFTQLHAMLGFTWVPNTSTNASLEYLQSYVFNEPTRHRSLTGPAVELLWPIEAPQIAVRVSHTFLDEKATFNLLLLLIGISPFNAFTARVDVGYKLTETFQVNLGYVAYHAGTEFGPLYGFGMNDRVLLNLRWDFSAH